ncbi:MAG: Sensory transduction protein regX3 [Candidatus Izimaplasma bacterium HR2]|nr:MAG: Sensory transduction protein regX3 [Candidatus Izimaplasma bacterium HR2]
MSYTVLIIEDELSLQSIVAAYFKKSDYSVITASDGLEGLEKFRLNNIDIVCCDVMMPNINGWNVVKSIRQTSNIPIIMMTALDSEKDQLYGFDLEVDDYITKPFSPAVLVAKVNNILKRLSNTKIDKIINSYKLGNFEIQFDARLIKINDKEIHLSKTEFDLLEFMIKNKGIVLDRVTILDEVWGMDVYVEERVVDTNIKVLRKKLEDYGKYIKTVFGIGYKYEDET